MSLPTKDKYEALKEKRKQEQEKKLQQERLVCQGEMKWCFLSNIGKDSTVCDEFDSTFEHFS